MAYGMRQFVLLINIELTRQLRHYIYFIYTSPAFLNIEFHVTYITLKNNMKSYIHYLTFLSFIKFISKGK